MKRKMMAAMVTVCMAAAMMAGCSSKQGEETKAISESGNAAVETEKKEEAKKEEPKAQTTYEKVMEKKVLVVGTEGTYKPFTYHDEKNELVGYDVEVAKAIGDKLGVEVKFSEITWEGLLASLDNGTIDLVLNQVGVTEERKAKYDFTDPYIYSYTALIVNDSNSDITSWESAKGKKTSLNVSSNYAIIAEEYGMDITASDTFSKDIELLLAGRTDCVINNTIAFNDYMSQKSDTPIKIAAILETPDTVCVPVPKGNEDLVAAVNQAIKELQEDGTLTKISEKYLNKDFSKEMSLEELQK